MDRKSLCGLTVDEISHLAGTDAVHSTAIANCLYKKKITDISQFPGISKKLKKELNERFYPAYLPLSLQRSSDATLKYLFRNSDGLKYRTVYLPDAKRTTVCVSTQSGLPE